VLSLSKALGLPDQHEQYENELGGTTATWEIAETAGHGLPVMGVRLFDEDTTQIPAGLRRAALISRLDVSSVVLRLQAWSARTGGRHVMIR
jgi:hypothetical protein